MKTIAKNRAQTNASHIICGIHIFLVAAYFVPLDRAAAQIFKTVHSFAATGNSFPPANDEGAYPQAGLYLFGNALYGATVYGGTSGYGALFSVNMDGSDYTNLYSFGAGTDGQEPETSVVFAGKSVFGVTLNNSYPSSANAELFAVNTNGSVFGNLPASIGYDAGVMLSGNTLYGWAETGGASGMGEVFTIKTNGGNYTNLHSFPATSAPYFQGGTNSDGAYPNGPLTLSGNRLYGTALYGGAHGSGSLYFVSTDGMVFSNLYSFSATVGGFDGSNLDGAYPGAGIVVSGNMLYGTAERGGKSGFGSVFAINNNGSGFTNLHNFSALSGSTDGAVPQGGVILVGSKLYGATAQGGLAGNGTVYMLNLDGTGFTVLHGFSVTTGTAGFYSYGTNSDGASPRSGLILAGNALYGTTSLGGMFGSGAIYSVALPPQLSIILSNGNVVISWPATNLGFVLESATRILQTPWSTNLPAPVVVNSNYTVTVPKSGQQEFFQLAQ